MMDWNLGVASGKEMQKKELWRLMMTEEGERKEDGKGREIKGRNSGGLKGSRFSH